MCRRYRAVTAPIGRISPHEMAFMIPCAVLSVLMLSCWVAEEPDRTSMVAMEERSLDVVGCMVGE